MLQKILAVLAAAVLLFGCNQQASAPDSTASGDTAAESSGGSEAVQIDLPYEEFTLDNGLRVVVHTDRKAPVVAVSVWYHVGSKDERPGKTGFAHLFEHIMFNGTENFDDEYFKPFEQVGTTGMNGTTWFDRTNYFETVPTPALDMALWMESDRMGHLLGAVTQEKLDEQRGVVQNEKRQGDNQPYGKVEYRRNEGLFPEGHPYRWSTIGSMEDLNAASLDDIHEWFKEYYGAANAVIVLAGDIDAETARPLIEKNFGDIPSGPPLHRMDGWVPERTENTREEMQDRVAQTRIYRIWAVPGRTKRDEAELNLAAEILGGGKNSRLYKALVYDRQIAVNATASVESHELTSFFTIDVMVKPGSDASEVESVIDDEVARFLADGPTNEELSRVKTSISAGFVRGLEQVGGFGGKAVVLAQGAVYAGDPGFYVHAYYDWLNSGTVESVKAASNEWLADGYYQLTVTPFPDYTAADAGADRSHVPVVSTTPDLTFPAIQTASLDNGIEVVLAERHAIPVVQIALQFDAGYAADFGRKLGTAGFTLAMLDEGTASRSALEISAEAERLGAQIGTASTLDTSRATLSALTSNLGESVALFADVVRNPAFSGEEMERLRQRWLANIQQEKTQPVSLALRNLPPLLYGQNHPYGIPFTGSGTEASINSLTRDDLTAFHSDWLRPDNARIFVVGDTSLDAILPLLNNAFGNWQAGEGARPEKPIGEVPAPEQARVIIFDRPGSPQSMILAGHLVPPTGDPNAFVVDAMNEILGGSFTARINMNLREDKSWSYGAFTFIPDARGPRPWVIFAPVQTDRTADSLRELMREITEFQSNRPATDAELQKVVNNNIRSLPGQFETAGSVLGSLLSSSRFDRAFDYPTTLKAKYEGLTTGEIQAAADNDLKPGQLVWLIIGDRAQIQDSVAALNLGTLEFWDRDGNPIGP